MNLLLMRDAPKYEDHHQMDMLQAEITMVNIVCLL
jgi:hypothetical protein